MITLSKTLIDSVFSTNKFLNTFDTLAWRWADEGGYENINDYAAPFEKIFNDILKTSDFTGALKMTKRPFGFEIVAPYTLQNGNTIPSVTIIFACTTKGLSWKVTA